LAFDDRRLPLRGRSVGCPIVSRPRVASAAILHARCRESASSNGDLAAAIPRHAQSARPHRRRARCKWRCRYARARRSRCTGTPRYRDPVTLDVPHTAFAAVPPNAAVTLPFAPPQPCTGANWEGKKGPDTRMRANGGAGGSAWTAVVSARPRKIHIRSLQSYQSMSDLMHATQGDRLHGRRWRVD
jgi:hypothetical protein